MREAQEAAIEKMLHGWQADHSHRDPEFVRKLVILVHLFGKLTTQPSELLPDGRRFDQLARVSA